MHKARQVTGAETPGDTDDETSDHKIGKTTVTCSEGYKVYRMTGEDEEEQEPTREVYRTIEGGNRKTSFIPPLML